MNHTSPQIERSYYTDQRISGLNSWNFSVFARYSINDWLAVRAGLSTVDKSFRYEYKLPYKGGTHYDFNDTYLEVPVMAKRMNHYGYVTNYEIRSLNQGVVEGKGVTPDQEVLFNEVGYEGQFKAAIDYIKKGK